jgi:Kef-type K+ transport system membrane component KefB
MTSSLSNLTSLLLISTVIALTGLLVPIALSFILMPLGSFPALHAFAAGSALSSTSLGTVLTLLNPASLGFDLRKTRLGTALLSAAVMDDVVAFILVKVIGQIGNNTGASSSSALGSGIGRTIGVTIGLGVVVVPLSKYVFKPLYARLGRMSWWKSETLGGGQPFLMMIMTVWFVAMVAASGYAGTSPLYGSYVGGLVVAHVAEVDEPAGDHIDRAILMEDATARSDNHPSGSARDHLESECTLSRRTTYTMPDSRPPSPPRPAYHGLQRASPASTLPPPIATPLDGPEAVPEHDPGLVGAFEKYIAPLLAYFLLPVFFGSIGYCIPFIPLWRGRIIWRGIVYAILMILGKMFCGLWLIVWADKSSGGALGSSPQSGDIDVVGSDERLAEISTKTGKAEWVGVKAAAMLGLAMIARGEIGLL